MYTADIAAKVLHKLKPKHFQILHAIEKKMSKHQYVPEEVISNTVKLPSQKISRHLKYVHKYGLIQKWSGSYVGYELNTVGYDCLALNDLVEANILQAFGKPLGVGKESNVYDSLTAEGRRVAVKLHRLGRTSFRQTRRKRGYFTERRRINWLHQSKLAAKKEFKALKLVYSAGVDAPEPVSQNRHIIVMEMIDGTELFRYREFLNPERILKRILLNVRKAYLKAGIIHGDLSEYNIMLQPNLQIHIIDWPQYVDQNHPNAEQLLKRDIKNILKFFEHKQPVKTTFEEVFAYTKGKT
jgi:RIO kinase 2